MEAFMGFDECYIQTKTHKHQMNLTMGHWNVGSRWKQKGFEVDELISKCGNSQRLQNTTCTQLK
jgi:hypothetical protein